MTRATEDRAVTEVRMDRGGEKCRGRCFFDLQEEEEFHGKSIAFPSKAIAE